MKELYYFMKYKLLQRNINKVIDILTNILSDLKYPSEGKVYDECENYDDIISNIENTITYLSMVMVYYSYKKYDNKFKIECIINALRDIRINMVCHFDEIDKQNNNTIYIITSMIHEITNRMGDIIKKYSI